MNKDEAKGQQEDLEGREKEAAGALADDKAFQAEGTVERATGATREGIAEADAAIKRKVDQHKEEKAKKDKEDE